MSDGLPGTNLLVCQSQLACKPIIFARPQEARFVFVLLRRTVERRCQENFIGSLNTFVPF